MVLSSAPESTSIWERVKAELATQSEPPPTATSLGEEPAGIVLSTECDRGSTRDSVCSPEFSTHTASRATTTDVGVSPTGVAAMTFPDEASITPSEFGATTTG